MPSRTVMIAAMLWICYTEDHRGPYLNLVMPSYQHAPDESRDNILLSRTKDVVLSRAPTHCPYPVPFV